MTEPAPSLPEGGLPIRLTDCLAPFWTALGVLPEGALNWSKTPFAEIEANGLGELGWEERFFAEAARYLDAIAAVGYTAIVVDDLAHLVAHAWYPPELRRTLARWGTLYRRLFAAARNHGLSVYVTSDYCFFNPAIDAHLRLTGERAEVFFAATLAAALRDWPEIAGVVLRIGESDGVDVAGAFVSRLTLRRPAEAQRLLQRVLPYFEECGKTLVFRTWTLGAYPIGDLIWNPRTWDAVFAGIDSSALIVSLKYGETDFFRYLPLNPLFFHGPQRKLIELQTRREYEGMGEFPAFAGWLYEKYLRELAEKEASLAGVFAIQAGGWAPFRTLPFCGDGSIWNELNSSVVAGLAQGRTVEESVRLFCIERAIADADRFLELLHLADAAIEDGLYIREFAQRQHYFRRVRIPPLLWIFWHNVTTGGLIALLHRSLVRDTAAAIAEGHRAVQTVSRMLDLARALGLDEAPFRFQLETFRLLALQRQVLLGVASAETRRRLAMTLPGYSRRYPHGYRFDVADHALASEHPAGLIIRLLTRSGHAYRWPDRLHLNQPMGRLLAAIASRISEALPSFAGRHGMSPETLLR